MNIYYKVYYKGGSKTSLYILFISNFASDVRGKVLLIESLAYTDQDIVIGQDYTFVRSFCTKVIDKNKIHELDKLAIFQ